MEWLVQGLHEVFGIAPWGLLVVCSLVFIAGYVDSIAGGGGLISLPAYMIVGLPTHTSIATNKLASAMGTTVATWHYAKSGFIQVKLAIPSIICAFIGSFFGSNLVLLVSDYALKIILLFVLPLTALYVMKTKQLGNNKTSTLTFRQTVLICCCVAMIVGAYDGFYGPGTGTFLMLLLSGAAQLRLDASAGITKAINLSTNIAALAVFLFHGEVLISLGLLAGVFSIAGNYVGSHKFTSQGGSVAKPITIVVLVIFLIKIIYDLSTGA